MSNVSDAPAAPKTIAASKSTSSDTAVVLRSGKRKPLTADLAATEAGPSDSIKPADSATPSPVVLASSIPSAPNTRARRRQTPMAKGNTAMVAAPRAVAETTIGLGATKKSEVILKLLRRKKGASIEEMQQATGWQAHSVRGFLSGSVKKRMGLALTSAPASDGTRRYVVVVG